MLVKLDTFAGTIPRLDPHLLPQENAVIAQNCKLTSGSLKPWKNVSTVNTPSKTGTKSSIFLYEDTYWLHWVAGADVNVCKSPVANDAHTRLYWTGDSVPKMGTLASIVTGGTDYPMGSYTLGIPAPLTAPSVMVFGTITNPDPTLIESRSYVVRYVSAYGEVGPPSPPSAIVDVAPGQYVEVYGMPVAPEGSYNITNKDIYRSNAGQYQYVATVPIATVGTATYTEPDAENPGFWTVADGYTDNILSANLGEVLDSLLYDPPPAGLKGLISLPNGSLAGYVGSLFCVSVPYQPHAWPANQQYPVSNAIMGIGAYGSSVLITTTGAPYFVNVGGDLTALQPERSENGYACIAKRGVVDMGYAVAYPSTIGLVVAGVNGVSIVTAKSADRDAWQTIVGTPAAFQAYFYGGLYFAWTSSGTYIIDPNSGEIVTLSGITATAGFHNSDTGNLYLQVGANIVKWEGNTTLLTYTWRSRPFVAPRPVNMACAKISADTYPVTFKLYVDGSLMSNVSVANSNPFWLIGGYKGKEFSAELSGTGNVYSVIVSQSMDELRKAALS